MISIIIPLYNKETCIYRTLQSVFAQTFQDYEIIIVNDGSTDNSVKEVEKCADARIRLIHQPNAGVSAARNRGIEEAKFELIAFLDADDEWKPEYLQTQYELYRKYPECSVYACNYEFCSSSGKVTPTLIRKLPFHETDGILHNYFEVASCSHPPLWTSAVMVRKSAIQSIGRFPEGIKSGEDLLTWARLAVRYRIAYIPKVLSVFIYDRQAFNDDQKKREPESKDFIGKELKRLYTAHPHISGLRTYNALWHKMRARIFLSKRQRVKALKEICISAKYQISYKIICFLALTILPYSLIHKVFKE